MLVPMRSILILAGLAVSLAAASQEIYRWVDKDGKVRYGDTPPPGAKKSARAGIRPRQIFQPMG